MSQKTLSYRGYYGSVEFDLDDEVLHGKVLWVRDLITYEGNTISELREDFQTAIDDYIRFCAERGLQPKQTFTGTFQVRIGADLHERAAVYAYTRGQSLNQFVRGCLEEKLSDQEYSSADTLFVTYAYHPQSSDTAESSPSLTLRQAAGAPQERPEWKIMKSRTH